MDSMITSKQYESISSHIIMARNHGRQVIRYEFPESHDHAVEPDVLADMNAVRQALTSYVSSCGHPELASALDAEHVCLRLIDEYNLETTPEQRTSIKFEYESVRFGIANYMRQLENQMVPDAVAEAASASPASEPAADDDNDAPRTATPALDALKRDLLTVIEEMIMEEYALASFATHSVNVRPSGIVGIVGDGYDDREQQRVTVHHGVSSRALMNHILMKLFGG